MAIRFKSLSILTASACLVLHGGATSAGVLQYLGFTDGTASAFTNGLEGQVSDTQTLTDAEFGDVTLTITAVQTDTGNPLSEVFGVNAAGAGVNLNEGGPDRPFFNEIGEVFTISFDAAGVLDDIRSVAGTSNTGDIVTVTNLTTNVSQNAEVQGNSGQVQSLPFSLAFSSGDILQVETSSTSSLTADWQIRRIDVTIVPEPGAAVLGGLGGLMMLFRRRPQA